MSFAAAAAATRLLQEAPGAIPAAEGGPGWSFTAYDDALILCVSARVIKVVLVTLLTVRTRIVSATFRKTPEETSNDEDNGKAVTFIIFYIFKPLLLAGMPGKPDDDVVSEETQTAVRSRSVLALTPRACVRQRWLKCVVGATATGRSLYPRTITAPRALPCRPPERHRARAVRPRHRHRTQGLLHR